MQPPWFMPFIPHNSSWYVFDWSWRECKKEESILDNCVAIIQNSQQMELLFDMNLEATNICVDSMSQREIVTILNLTSKITLIATRMDNIQQ